MKMDNFLVITFLCLPFLVFIGLKISLYRQKKLLESKENMDSVMHKHAGKIFEHPSLKVMDKEKKDKAA